MPVLETEFEVFCSCGEPMCNKTTTRTSRGRRIPQLVVEPCPKCLDEEYYKGKNEGYQAGREYNRS